MDIEEFFDTFPKNILAENDCRRHFFPGKNFDGKQWIDEETGFYCAIIKGDSTFPTPLFGYVGFKIAPHQEDLFVDHFFQYCDEYKERSYTEYYCDPIYDTGHDEHYYDPRSGRCIVAYSDRWNQERLKNIIEIKCTLLKDLMGEVLR